MRRERKALGAIFSFGKYIKKLLRSVCIRVCVHIYLFRVKPRAFTVKC